MQFGVFYEHQLPRPWTEDSEYLLLNDSLDQIELADGLGYDYAWEVEHHFLEEYSHSSAPEVFLGAASQRTSRIRLGHGIIQLTTNHPARVAERVSTLDLVSHGRVELGLGESATTTELHPFDRRFRDKRAVWEDAVRALLPMFWSDAWEYHGEHFDFPLRNVIPKPRQKPHPPLWVACSQLETIRMAGTRGWVHSGFSSSRQKRHRRGCTRTTTCIRNTSTSSVTTPPTRTLLSFPNSCALPTDEEALSRAEGSSFFQFRSAITDRIRRGYPVRSSSGMNFSPIGRPRPDRRPVRGASSGPPRQFALACASSRSRTSTR